MRTLRHVLLIAGILFLNHFSTDGQGVKRSTTDELAQLIVAKYSKELSLSDTQREALFKETKAYIESMEQIEKRTTKNQAEKISNKQIESANYEARMKALLTDEQRDKLNRGILQLENERK